MFTNTLRVDFFRGWFKTRIYILDKQHVNKHTVAYI